jgi:hypothetical protein
MSGPLDQRLTALERAPGARGVDLRVYGTHAEADADPRPPGPGMKVLKVITGVVRGASPHRL